MRVLQRSMAYLVGEAAYSTLGGPCRVAWHLHLPSGGMALAPTEIRLVVKLVPEAMTPREPNRENPVGMNVGKSPSSIV